jgi:hypothetical protein
MPYPPFLKLMARREEAEPLADKAFQRITDDEAWEEELRRRRRIEASL